MASLKSQRLGRAADVAVIVVKFLQNVIPLVRGTSLMSVMNSLPERRLPSR